MVSAAVQRSVHTGGLPVWRRALPHAGGAEGCLRLSLAACARRRSVPITRRSLPSATPRSPGRGARRSALPRPTSCNAAFAANAAHLLTYEAPDGLSLAAGAFDDPSQMPPTNQFGVECSCVLVDAIPALPERATLDDLEDAPFLTDVVSYQHPDRDTQQWPEPTPMTQPNPNTKMPKWLLYGLIAKAVLIAAVIHRRHPLHDDAIRRVGMSDVYFRRLPVCAVRFQASQAGPAVDLPLPHVPEAFGSFFGAFVTADQAH